MIPVLFKEDEQVFTHNGIGTLYESLFCDVIEEENGAFTMELEYPVDGEWFSEIKDFRIIQAKPNDIDEPHNFRIYEIEKSIDELTVFVRANTITNDLGNNLITNYVGKNVTPQQAMNGIKNNLIEPTNFDLISDIQTESSVEWTRINPLNAIVGVRGSLIDIWGGQLKRTNTAIHLYSRRGRDNVVTIRPGKNIEGLNMTVSTAGLITKILPTFSYRPVDVPKYQMVTLSNGTKEKRRVPTSGGTTLRDDITVLGDVVSSQYANNYPTNYWSSVDYGDDEELRDKVDNYIDTRLTAAEESSTILNMSGFENDLKNFVKTELDKRAKQYFTHRNPGVDKPTVRITVNMLQLSDSPDWEEFKDLEQIGLTDTLDVWVEKYDIDVEVRVTSLTYESIAELVTNFNAGSDGAPRQSAIEKKYDDLTKATNDYITSFKNGVQNIMRNTSDGLNRKFEGYTEPPAELSSEGDIWFKEIGEGKVEIWIHDGVYWQPLMTEDFVEQMVMDLAVTQAEFDEAKLQAIADSEQALADAIAHAEAEDARIRGELESDIGGAIDIAEQAKADAVSKANQALVDAKAHADAEIVLMETHFDGVIEGVESDVAVAKQTADSAIHKINNDIANKFTSLDAELVDIEAISNAAKTNAQTAINHSLDALEDASTALTDASQALTEVQNKVDTFDFDNTVGIINTGIQDAMDEAELATNTLRDSTGQLIKSQDLKIDIDGITSSLTSYAKTTDLNGLATETFVTNKGYQTAAQVSSTLGAYAKTTDLNGLVSQTWVENKGYATASEVSSELSSYAKSSDLTGLATETYVTTRGYQTASQISTTLSAYEKTSSLNTKLAGKANVGDIPSLTGYAKESWVENKSYATAASVATSLTAYEKITDVNAKLADKADIDDIPDITGLASETWVENKSYATAASVTTQLSSYAKTSQLTGLATETFVTNKGYQTAAQVTTTLSSYAKTSQLTGLATETFVTSKGYQTASQVSTTLASYAKTTDLSGLATETFVTSKGYQTAAQVTTTLSSYVKTSTLSGYATVATVNAIKSTADTNKATISTNTGKISTIEQNVSGLQTTVASKAAQSQVTQLANSLSAVVSKTDQISEWTRSYSVNTANPKELVDINGSRLSKGYSYEVTLGVISTGTVTNFIASLTSNSAANAWTLTIHEQSGTSSNHPYLYLDSSGNPMVSLYSHTSSYTVVATVKKLATRSKTSLTMLSDNINLRVAKNDIVNQINVSTEGILIAGSKIHITGTTTIDTGVIKNAHIGDLNASKINAGTINAARLNAPAIVTAGLTANVVKSTHIETSTATIDKIFATDAMVNRLTAKTAFISSVQAVNISAARITSGTIAAARLNASAIVTAGLSANVVKATHISGDTALFDKLFATSSATDRLSARSAWIKTANIADLSITNAKIANTTIASGKIASLDVSKLSGNISTFMRTSWGAATGNSMRINGTSLDFYSAANKTSSIFTRQGTVNPEAVWKVDTNRYLVFENSQGPAFRIGDIGYSGFYTDVNFWNNRIFGVSKVLTDRVEFGKETNRIGHSVNQIIVRGDSEFVLGNKDRDIIIANNTQVTINRSIDMKSYNIRGLAALTMNGQLTLGGSEIRSPAGGNTAIESVKHMYLRANGAVKLTIEGNLKMGAALDTNGYAVIGNSDERLKTNIVDDEIDSLSAIMSWRMAGFNWIDDSKPTERQFSVIAQSAPDISFEDDEGMLQVVMSKQVNMNSHAIQQLALIEQNTNEVASQALQLGESNKSEIDELREENEELRNRIEELESVA